MSAKAVPPARATTLAGAVSSASGSSSPSTIHTIAPAANPKPTGRIDVKLSTNRNAGTASSGCGRLEKMLQPAAAPTEAPRGTRTRLIASPSGCCAQRLRSRSTDQESIRLRKQLRPRCLRRRNGLSSRRRSAAPAARPPPAAIPSRVHGRARGSAPSRARSRRPEQSPPRRATGCDRRPAAKDSRSPRASHRTRLRSTPPTQTRPQSARRKAAERQARSPTPSPAQQKTP